MVFKIKFVHKNIKGWEKTSKEIDEKWKKLKKNAFNPIKKRADVILTEASKHEPPIEISSSTKEVTISSDIDEPSKNAIDLLKAVKDEGLTGKEMSIGERQLVVRLMKDAGHTQDQISSALQVSMRTIVADYRSLREKAAVQVASMELMHFAGEVVMTSMNLMNKSIQEKMYKTASNIQKDMIELLQSMGIIYRAPKTMQSLTLTARMNASRKGFNKYMETMGGQKKQVESVLDELMECLTGKHK